MIRHQAKSRWIITRDKDVSIRKMYMDGAKIADIAERFGVSKGAICDSIGRTGGPHRNGCGWSRAADQSLRELILEGRCWRVVAIELEVKEEAARVRAARLFGEKLEQVHRDAMRRRAYQLAQEEWSRADIAAELGVVKSTICKWLKRFNSTQKETM